MQFQRDRFQVLGCRGCGLRFLDPQPTASELNELYGESYFAGSSTAEPGYDRYVDEIENHRRTFAERIRRLPSPLPGQRLLDVGASIGVFVEQARRAGWEAEGIEPSEWASSYARGQLGQPVRTGIVDRTAAPAGHYQVITMWEVVEHLPDPAAVLADLHHLLAPGGILALSTPDAGSLVTRLMGRRWPGWQKIPEHLYFFDRGTLDRLLRGAGLEPFEWRHVSLTVSRRYLWDRLARLMPLPPQRWISPRWMERSVRVNPGYDLMVMARRPT